MTDRPRVPAVGGERDVPAPDPIARDYLLLALRLGQRIPGLIDGYFGPADLKAQVDMEQLRPPERLVVDAADLAERVEAQVDDPARRAWLRAQLVALETHARAQAGTEVPYLELVSRCFDGAVPVRRDDAVFLGAAEELHRLVPGSGDLRERLAAWDRRMVVPPERLTTIIDWLVDVTRERAAALFGLPPEETLRVSLVTDQPWSGYNWYDGGLRSRVDVNTDLPVRAPELVSLVAHETYPGHHLEHAWRETVLVEDRGQLEASLLLINAPECFISEGLAEVGRQFVVPVAREVDLFDELFERARVGSGDAAAARRADAELAIAIRDARLPLEASAANGALMLHVDGVDRATVAHWLETVAQAAPERAAHLLEFLEHPLWRTYAFVYSEGAELLERWLAAVSLADRPARFRRLLVEPLTPSAIVRELSAD
jgi:hypothetical protein